MNKRLTLVGILALLIVVGVLFWRYGKRPEETVRTFANGDVTLTIPSGALPDGMDADDLRVEPSSTLPAFRGYRLLPDGTAFRKPITISLRSNAKPGALPLVIHISKGEIDIPDQQAHAYDPMTGQVTLIVPIQHFSELAVSESALFQASVSPETGSYAVGKPIPFLFTITQAKTGAVSAQTEKETITLLPGYHVSGRNGSYTFLSLDEKIEPDLLHVTEQEVAPGTNYTLQVTLKCRAATQRPDRFTMGSEGIPIEYRIEKRAADGTTKKLTRYLSLVHPGAAYTCTTGEESTLPVTTRNPDGSVSIGTKKYYVVTSTDPKGDTGNEVCARAGKSCVGYTDLTIGTCLAMHPGARVSEDFNGSSAGFYCGGPPQGGICGQEVGTCHICPKCNINMDCAMEIGVLYRETYVECQ